MKKKVKIYLSQVKNKILRKKIALIFIFALLVPILLLIIDHLFPDILLDSYGDLLTYYGVLLGIYISFLTYQDGKIKEEKQRRNELKPQFMVEFSAIPGVRGAFALSIINCGSNPLRMVCLNGDASISVIEKRDCFNIDCRSDEECCYDFGNSNPCVYIPPDDEGYPSFIQICCNDSEGNIWAFDFRKVQESEKVCYYPNDFYII